MRQYDKGSKPMFVNSFAEQDIHSDLRKEIHQNQKPELGIGKTELFPKRNENDRCEIDNSGLRDVPDITGAYCRLITLIQKPNLLYPSTRLMRSSVKISASSTLLVENSEMTAPSLPALNQCLVFGYNVYCLPGVKTI